MPTSWPCDIPTFVSFLASQLTSKFNYTKHRYQPPLCGSRSETFQQMVLRRVNLLHFVPGQGHRRNIKQADKWNDALDVMPSIPEWPVFCLIFVSSIFPQKIARNSGLARKVFCFVFVLLRLHVAHQTTDGNGGHAIPKRTATSVQNFLFQEQL